MLGHSRRTGLAVLALTIFVAGCGSPAQEDLDLLRSSVITALDEWKRGSSSDSLMSLSPPIEFYDEDWQRDGRLISYEVTNVYRDTDGSPRCAVTLNLQDVGKSKAVKVTYQANISSKVVIARDPYS